MKTFAIILSLFCIHIHSTYAQDISFDAVNLYPEGVAYDPAGDAFYVSSVKTGTIGKVNEGKYSVFYQDKNLKSSYGMKVDVRQNKLWVCVADPNYSQYRDSATFKKMSRVIALDLKTGQKTTDVDLAVFISGKHFVNDLTLDGKGNVYITDSFAGAIYRIGANGKATLLLQHTFFKGADVGLNGIVYHPDNYLLAINSTRGAVYKITLSNPSAVSIVKIDQFFPGGDGLWLDKQQNLFLIQNKGVNKIFKLKSQDKFQSAQVDAVSSSDQLFRNVTTATQKNDMLYALDSRMNELQDSTILKPADKFTIHQVNLVPLQQKP